MKIITTQHPFLYDTKPISVDDPRPFLERIIDTIHCPDILEDDDFWKAMNEKVLNSGHILLVQQTQTGTSVRIIQ